ncbi:MAG: aminotransferase class V-fold PLP-dependent enzyme [Marinilabiliales bacterium]|nr:MAG: aminotransferase class V-fold PLP-dependent enzyme [Marinilabiliales bacterium]
MTELEKYFTPFRQRIVGVDASFESPFGLQKVIYADWIASGRLYADIEARMSGVFGPFVGNTHTETSHNGSHTTHCYHLAQKIIKKHVNAGSNDVIITAGSGMTTVVNKLQRILGLKGCGKLMNRECLREIDRPVVFLTHMEHHSNHTSWYETIADVVLIEPDENLLVNLDSLRTKLKDYTNRKFKIGAFTACSNVTGIKTPYRQLARIMHEHGGVCFVDFAASAPYVDIDMHPPDPMEKLDAIYFSPHKFLGGPGSSGVLIFDASLYNSESPDDSGGGTVDWTNPWGKYKYVDDIEAREDGGTPGFLQAIRAALAIELKELMGTSNIIEREGEIVNRVFNELRSIEGIKILADNVEDRLAVFSFYHSDIHYNLFVKLLNDKFGIQVRGGCACAGTYGHFLLEVSHEKSQEITDMINHGDLSSKPGWVRMSLHPTTTDKEIGYIIEAVRDITLNHKTLASGYRHELKKNEFVHKSFPELSEEKLAHLFEISTGF